MWPSGVLDFSNKNDNWTITPLSHISLIPQYGFFITSINYSEEEASHSEKKIKYKRVVIKADHEWHNIKRYNLIMPQKWNDKTI